MRLALNLATRGRPQLLLSTIKRTLENIRDPLTILMVSADHDDQPTVDMLNTLYATGALTGVLVSIKPREDTIAAKWNRVLAEIPGADVYMPMCDDGPAITPGFDEKILEAASRWPDGIGVVFNHLENLSFSGIQAMTRRWVELTGYIYPEHFPYWFVDHWVSDLAEMADRVGYADVRLDCATNRPPTMEMREPAFWATFYDACKIRRRREMAFILDALVCVTPAWQKQVLFDRAPLVEQYSTMVNDSVRGNAQMAAYAAQHAPDERYLRVKRAALDLLKNELLPEIEEHERDAA